MHPPELVRSWVSDVVGFFEPTTCGTTSRRSGRRRRRRAAGRYPAAGTFEDRTERMASMGIPQGVATSIAAAQGPEMSQAILTLYRSARQPALAEAGRALENAAARPGLALLATDDPYVGSTNSAVAPRTAPEPARRYLTSSDIGGCCRTRRAAQQRSPASGTRSVDRRAFASRRPRCPDDRHARATAEGVVGERGRPAARRALVFVAVPANPRARRR